MPRFSKGGLRSKPNIVIDPKDVAKLRGVLVGLERDFMRRETYVVRALKRAAEPMRREMGMNAPLGYTGVLKDSFRSEKLQRKYLGPPQSIYGKRRSTQVGIRVGASKRKSGGVKLAGWRAHFQELGTENHKAQPHIRPAIKKHLRPGGSFRTLWKYELQREYLKVLRKYKR